VFEIKGLDELSKKLENLGDRADAMNGTQDVPLSELLTPGFLAKYSRFLSEDEMFEASGIKVESPEDFAKIPDEEWDDFIQHNTLFATWSDMLSAAGNEWAAKKLGLEADES
jgi:hypothetical protein